MTVAIAALCKMQGSTAIIAAEDHMITAGDVEFEQPQPKIWREGPHALAMLYGDSAAQNEIAEDTETEVLHRGIREVSEIASIYQTNLMKHVRNLAEASILAPLNLTNSTFINNQQSLQPDLVIRLTRELQNHYYDNGLSRSFGGAIIIGADNRGGHIFRVEYGECVQLDRIGFSAAGSGQWHAESQFMFSRYTSDWDFPEALSLVYTAKKRAEVAPGVGQETDIVLISTNPPNVMHFKTDSPLVQRLEAIYRDAKQRHDEATSWQQQEVRNFIANLPQQNPPAPTATPATPVPSTSPATPASTQSNDQVSEQEPQT